MQLSFILFFNSKLISEYRIPNMNFQNMAYNGFSICGVATEGSKCSEGQGL